MNHKIKTYQDDCQTQSGYFVKTGKSYNFTPLVSNYGQLLNKYDLLCAIYEDATNEKRIKLSKEIAELETEIHKIERKY